VVTGGLLELHAVGVDLRVALREQNARAEIAPARRVAELGEEPAKFSAYAAPLLKYCRENKFHFPAKPWPASTGAVKNVAAGRIRA